MWKFQTEFLGQGGSDAGEADGAGNGSVYGEASDDIDGQGEYMKWALSRVQCDSFKLNF